ncbi:MAG TPA: ATP-binding cassette domain-containing protein, partial [Desertimonas sp.]|nr:ATP-binding cassette domain-containing protein [Desertimonas sp.]
MPSAAPLRGRGLTVSRGPLVVLDSINVTVASGETIGLVGPNGVGKSTLLGVLAGRIQPDRGSVERTPPAATVGYLPQEPRRDRVELVAAYLERRTGATAATAELDAATMALADREVGAENRYDRALQRWLSLGVADLPARIGAVWSELGLADDLVHQPTAALSGGEATRVGLASLLL